MPFHYPTNGSQTLLYFRPNLREPPLKEIYGAIYANLVDVLLN